MSAWKGRWPLGRGFERYYGFLGGETNQWYPDLVYDNHPIDPPYSPQEGYHLSKDLADRGIEFVRDAKSIAPGKPWFMYYSPGAGHAPHHVWTEWADRYEGRFDAGYEAIRPEILVPEAAHDLEVALEPGDHQDLLKQLWRLRERVEAARCEPARHEEVPGALRRGPRQHRRLDLDEALAVEVVARRAAHLVAQQEVTQHRRAAEIAASI